MSEPMDFSAVASFGASVPTICVSGELDMASAPELATVLESSIDRGDTDLIVDLAAVTFLDSSALTTFIRAHLRLRAVGRRLIIADASPAAARLLELAGLTEEFAEDPSTSPVDEPPSGTVPPE
jgi:anti-sigma B factor antagonist